MGAMQFDKIFKYPMGVINLKKDPCNNYPT